MTFCLQSLDQLFVQWPIDDSKKNTLSICIPFIILGLASAVYQCRICAHSKGRRQLSCQIKSVVLFQIISQNSENLMLVSTDSMDLELRKFGKLRKSATIKNYFEKIFQEVFFKIITFLVRFSQFCLRIWNQHKSLLDWWPY